MTAHTITLPEMALVAGTRVALGMGVGLLLAEKLQSCERRAAGWTLLATGLATTIPLVIEVMGDRPRLFEASPAQK